MPWQMLVTVLFTYWLIYFLLTIGAVAVIWLGWPYVSAILLFASFAALSLIGPIHLSWTRASFRVLIPAHLGHQALTVLVYAAHYAHAGLSSTGGSISRAYLDALYFSLTIWTTLGSAEFTVARELRLLTALEALTAVLFLPIFAAVFWQMLHEMTAPPEEAFLDRRRQAESRQSGPATGTER